MALQVLIDKQDNFELLRDQIAAILAAESLNQQALATAAGKDPELWKLDVYIERSNPFEEFLNNPGRIVPVVNVWVDNLGFVEGSSNISNRQKSDTVFHIDVYGGGIAQDDGGTGHIPGDEQSAKNVQRGVRLVRNILMAAENAYLQLPRGEDQIVWQRWIQSISMFQPEFENQQANQVQASRILFRVGHNELSPQYVPVNLEQVFIQFTRAEDGKVIIEAEYDYT